VTIEFYNFLANAVLAGSALAASIAAIRGLNTWQREKTWESDQALARKMAVALQRRQDSFRWLRNSIVSSGEMNLAVRNDPDAANEDEVVDHDEAWALAMNARLQKLTEAVLEYYGCQIEAEVVWGEEVGSLSRELGDLEFQVQLALDDIARKRSMERDVPNSQELSDFEIRNRKLAFGRKDDETDAEHTEKIDAIRSILKTKLGRKP